jgi:ABC-type Fe3+ transport system substrate-binding protein
MEFDNVSKKKMNLIFPSENLYYDVATFALIKQARNYSNAELMRQYLIRTNVNRIIAAKGHFFPIEATSNSKFAYQNQPINWALKNPENLLNVFSFGVKNCIKRKK